MRVEMVGQAKLRKVLEFLYVEICQRHVAKCVKEKCEGCEMNYPSQWDHACCMLSDQEQWACYYGSAIQLINLELIRDLCEDFTELLKIPMTPEWDHFIMNLPNMSSSLALMIVDDMMWSNEQAVVEFVNNMCDTIENANELNAELFDNFALYLRT